MCETKNNFFLVSAKIYIPFSDNFTVLKKALFKTYF